MSGIPETVFSVEATSILLEEGGGADGAARVLADMLGAGAGDAATGVAAPVAAAAARDARVPLLVEHYVACLHAGRALLGGSASKTASLLNMVQAVLAACAGAAAAAAAGEDGGAAAVAGAEPVWAAQLFSRTVQPAPRRGGAAAEAAGTGSVAAGGGASMLSGARSVRSVRSVGGEPAEGGGSGLGSSGGEFELFTSAEAQALDTWCRQYGTLFIAPMIAAALLAQLGAAGRGEGAQSRARFERRLVVETPMPAPPLSAAAQAAQ